eukprot:TRINITY_DN13944_c0_g1_i1.p1 TRINITY_DN13944_c0_g1~~TRINITY_DN13944_c0_g1_i1.p1  ORF type:complete len:347 (-),score=52.99 TRINITY_DN13944_c0_g1_i1:132-1172(-)
MIDQNEKRVEDCSYCHQPLNDSSQNQQQNIHTLNNNNENLLQQQQQQFHQQQEQQNSWDKSQQYMHEYNNGIQQSSQQQQQFHHQFEQQNQQNQSQQYMHAQKNKNQSQQQQQLQNYSQNYMHAFDNNKENQQQQQEQQLNSNENQQWQESQKIDILVENLQQMSRCLGDIRNHQIGMESEFRTFMTNVENKIETLNSRIREIENICDDKFGDFQKQIDQINQGKNPFLNNSYENFQQQQQQLTQQLENLRFNLSDKENQLAQTDQLDLFQNENQDTNKNLNLDQNIRNWGAHYPHGSNLPLGPVILGDSSQNRTSEQRLPLMTDRVPLGKAFAEGCCLEPKHAYS